jgi:acyl-CoA synthetase
MTALLTLHDPKDTQRYYGAGLWRNDTLHGLLLRNAHSKGDAFALRDPRVRLTWRETLDRVERAAEVLHAAGLRRGDRVSMWLPNRVEATIVFLACSRNGYVCNPSLHQNFTVAEIIGLLQSIRSSALIAQVGFGVDANVANVFDLAATLPSMKVVFVFSGNDQQGTPLGTRVFPPMDGDNASIPGESQSPRLTADSDPDKVVYLAFTSGTMGTPKGVMHSDNTLLANGRAMVNDWKLDGGAVLVSFSPQSHHIATVGLMQALISGCEFVLSQLTTRQSGLDWIEKTGATYVMGVPTHAIDVLTAAKERGLKKLHNVSTFYMAGAPIPTEVARQLMDLGAMPQNIYGMTENGSHQYTLPTDDLETIVSTCGRACDGYEIKLFSTENRDVEAAPGEIGEIGGRGAVRMLGYFGNQTATEDSFNSSGWFMSGDLGKIDAHGNLQVVGRSKDLIIRGGHNIHPARVEELVHRNPAIAKATVVGVPDERLGEKVCLAIVPAAGFTPTARDVLDHLHAAGLSKFDMPEYFLCLEVLPLTASGKILKRELTNWIAVGKVVPQPIRWTGTG